MDGSDAVQAAIYTHSLATLRALEAEGAQADVFAGLSLGEYTALVATGVLKDAQGASLVRKRGAFMDDAVAPGTGGMLSVVGLTLEQTEAAIESFENVVVANHLSETQMTLGGPLVELAEAKAALETAGARMLTMLDMRGPSHTPLLNPAAERFSKELAEEVFGEPCGAVYSNTLAALYPKDADYRALLCSQMIQRVRWHDSVEAMIASGVTRFVEIGPRGVLAKMLKRRVGRDIAVYSVQDEASLEAYLRAEKENLA
jgi:[acyl-carrier-protein] S-malonyltransferase